MVSANQQNGQSANTAEWMDRIEITVDGEQLSREVMDQLVDVTVDTSLYLPGMFVIQLHDESLELIDSGPFELGKPVRINMAAGHETTRPIISGEITALEPEYNENQSTILTVRGYDRSHRLTRGTKTRVFVKASDSEIVEKIAKESGLRANVESTSETYDHIFQHNQTDLAFLQERARRIGFEVFVDDDTLYFRKPQGKRGELTVEMGVSLHNFYPRLTLSGQVDKVIVKGWDVANKREIVGEATRSHTAPQINVGGGGGQLASQAFSSANQVVVRRPVISQGEADALAQAVLDEINAGFVEAEGVAFGNPRLIAGNMLTIEKLGKRFSGKYMVTSAVHVYSDNNYDVHFRVEGAQPKTIADLITQASSPNSEAYAWGGVVPAVVTNNNDEQGMGRVKVKFPWLDDSVASDWARVAGIGAGAERGMFWLPEVNDEVLVAFEHGDFGRPYVIGSLWNGKDKPPESVNSAVKQGRVETRTLKTRAGHTIRLVDESASQKIEIVDVGGANTITLDTRSKKITIVSQGDVEINSTGKTSMNVGSDLSLTVTGNASIEAGGKLNLRGAIVNIN